MNLGLRHSPFGRYILAICFIALGCYFSYHSLFSEMKVVPLASVIEKIITPKAPGMEKYHDIELKLPNDPIVYQIGSKYINEDGKEPELLPYHKFLSEVKAGDIAELLLDKEDHLKPRHPLKAPDRAMVYVYGIIVNGKTYLAPDSVERKWRDDIYYGLCAIFLGIFLSNL